jgi:hypothetical protein
MGPLIDENHICPAKGVRTETPVSPKQSRSHMPPSLPFALRFAVSISELYLT